MQQLVQFSDINTKNCISHCHTLLKFKIIYFTIFRNFLLKNILSSWLIFEAKPSSKILQHTLCGCHSVILKMVIIHFKNVCILCFWPLSLVIWISVLTLHWMCCVLWWEKWKNQFLGFKKGVMKCLIMPYSKAYVQFEHNTVQQCSGSDYLTHLTVTVFLKKLSSSVQ